MGQQAASFIVEKPVRFNLKFGLDIILVVMIIITPMVQYLNLVLRGLVFSFIVFFFWLLYIIIDGKHLRSLKQQLLRHAYGLLFLVLFVIIVLINYLFVSTTQYALQHFLNFSFYIVVVIIASYYSAKPREYGLSILVYIIILLGAQALISIPYLLSADSMTVRLFSSGHLDEEQSMEAIKNGVGTNGLYTSSAPLVFVGIGVLVAKVVKQLIARVLMIISLTTISLTIVMSTYFTPIFMLTIGGVFLLLFTYRNRLFSLRFMFILLIISLIGFGFYKFFLAETSLLYPVEKRITGFFDESQNVSGPREELARNSLNTFLANPLFGIGVPNKHSFEKIGEHFPWLDNFAQFGLYGFTPFIFFFTSRVYKNVKLYFLNDTFKVYRAGCFIGLTIYIVSNFASPMILNPNMYVIFIMYYTNLFLLTDKNISTS